MILANLETVAKRTKVVCKQRPACPTCQIRNRFRLWQVEFSCKIKSRGYRLVQYIVLKGSFVTSLFISVFPYYTEEVCRLNRYNGYNTY